MTEAAREKKKRTTNDIVVVRLIDHAMSIVHRLQLSSTHPLSSFMPNSINMNDVSQSRY